MISRIRIILCWIVLSVSISSVAQPRLSQPEYYLGVHGGAIASMVNWSPSVPGTSGIKNTAFLSGNGGLVFRYNGHKCCGLQLELNYAQKGWRETTDSHSYKRTLDYIEIPFMTHIWFGKPTFRGYVNIGPQIGYCIRETHSGTEQVEEIHQYNAIDKRFTWGVCGGLGFYGRSQKAGCFQLEARFNYNLGTLFKSTPADHFSQSNMMALSINLAYLFEIKPKKQK
ncbi:MAG: PorT family protein [Paludibacteraceae bacterium]|nr:PorT family protein [Paludibacteraceae bacterium]